MGGLYPKHGYYCAPCEDCPRRAGSSFCHCHDAIRGKEVAMLDWFDANLSWLACLRANVTGGVRPMVGYVGTSKVVASFELWAASPGLRGLPNKRRKREGVE